MPPDEPDYASLDPSSCMRTDDLVGHYMPHAYAYDDEMLASDVESWQLERFMQWLDEVVQWS